MIAASVSAFAVQIEVTRDSSYNGDTTQAGRAYTWYKVFDATYASNTSTGGGSSSGAPGNVSSSASTAAYTAVPAVANKLGSWVAATGTPGQQDYVAAHWQKANGNLWFDQDGIIAPCSFQ